MSHSIIAMRKPRSTTIISVNDENNTIHMKRCLKLEPRAAKKPAKAASIMNYKNRWSLAFLVLEYCTVSPLL